MTRSQIEKKYIHLQREVRYYARVYPHSKRLPILKSMYRHYKKIVFSKDFWK